MWQKLRSNLLASNNFIYIFLAFCGLSIFFADYKQLALHSFSHILIFTLFAIVIGKLIKKNIFKIDRIFALLAILAVIQSGIGFLQFAKQSSLGLQILGESVLGQQIPGVAKIVINGAKLVRAYGTFPHPNILAAFLLLGFFSLIYFWLKTEGDKRILTSVAIFIVSLGLLLTFSRAAWLIGILLSAAMIGYLFWKSQNRRQIIGLVVLLCSFILFLFPLLQTYVYQRLQFTADDPAVAHRLIYDRIGWEIIKNNPFGIGVGNQVFYSIKNGLYQKFGLTENWQFQPIHNIYILIASEVGVLALFSFLLFVIWDLFGTWNLDIGISKVMFLSLLLFGLFDHFLWTLGPGKLMLWLVIGILMGVNSARSSTDRMHPSEG